MLLISCVLFFLLLVYSITMITSALHMLQQNLYNENNRYIKWCIKNKKMTLVNMNMFAVIFSSLLFLSFHDISTIFFMVAIILVYIVSYMIDKEKRKLNQNKKPLVITKRIRRLILTISIIYLIPLLLYFFDNDMLFISIFSLSLLTTLNYYVVFLANVINYPIERIVFHHYERLAKSKLSSMPLLKVIGITGSYGKTSSKNILNEILSVRYNTLATPKSLNTFYGLMITINNKLTKFDDVFIAEMGAYVRGEINGLCKLVNPKYGIITTIGTAHLETFGSEDNIINGKMELIEYLPSDGVGVLNGDDIKQVNYKIKNDCKIIWIGIENKAVDVLAKNIKCGSKGTTFDVKFKGESKLYSFETKLLGKHNVYNILAALALGRYFGITIKDLQFGVKRVKTIEHRLELKKLGNIYQIDDAYNSNPVGAKAALDVLGSMDGVKVVVTPGMVELGDKEYEYNKIFGEQIAYVADKVILIGENKTKAIMEGLKNKKFNKDDIYVLNDVRESYKLLNRLKDSEDLYALFENDLPDTYTEK